MPGCCGDYRDTADPQFSGVRAAKELHAYRRGRVGPTTRAIRDAVVNLGLNSGSLLDIGGGCGALTFELLDRGMAQATIVDASSAYVTAARDEAARRGRSSSTDVIHGDAVHLAGELPRTSLVTLDRVVCCYPSYEPLLAEAARHAERGLALSYPRDRWFVRAVVWLDNAWRRARASGFRSFVHPPGAIRKVIEQAGFRLAERRTTLIWASDIFQRRA